MNYEVEQKFPVVETSAAEAEIVRLGGEFATAISQSDRYFTHPGRDFSKTDEALRIRSVGDANRVTYKGPKLDTTTKTRQEIEIEIASGSAGAAQFAEMLTLLGFRETATVQKTRRTAQLLCDGFDVEFALDDVEGLGQFVEIEIVTSQSELDAARTKIHQLAAKLGLDQPEKRSYLELQLAKTS
ncbi:MAG: class IV adenylate cyclase [Pirellulales bacterium]|nr:class IV adenylate cyclase [Pirellulales bacterium]